MRDVTNKKNDTPLNKVMTRANVARASMTVASVSQKMIYEGYDMMPVVYENYTYAGIITKSDLLQSLQKAQEESQVAHTFSDNIANSLVEKGSAYTVTVEPFMINSVGTIANGVFAELITQVVQRVFAKKDDGILSLKH